jgi:hypothetical protein
MSFEDDLEIWRKMVKARKSHIDIDNARKCTKNKNYEDPHNMGGHSFRERNPGV